MADWQRRMMVSKTGEVWRRAVEEPMTTRCRRAAGEGKGGIGAGCVMEDVGGHGMRAVEEPMATRCRRAAGEGGCGGGGVVGIGVLERG